VDADGNCLLLCLFSVEIRDRSGRRIRSWDVPPGRPPTDAAWLPDGRIVICFPNRVAVDIFSRDGHLAEPFDPGGERFVAPTGIAVAPDGTILIMEESGRARVFRTPAGRWAPVPVGAFAVAYPEAPYPPDLAACAFDGTKQALFPHRSLAAPLAYDLEGRPLMAAIPGRDLSAK
jgi:sugar lactone lactonase YvrE